MLKGTLLGRPCICISQKYELMEKFLKFFYKLIGDRYRLIGQLILNFDLREIPEMIKLQGRTMRFAEGGWQRKYPLDEFRPMDPFRR